MNGSVRVAAVVLLGVLLAGVPAPSVLAATQEQIDGVRTKALAWLLTHQNGDGSWRSGLGAEAATTAMAVEALSRSGVRSYPYGAGIAWLGNATLPSVDSLARAIVALQPAGVTVSSALERLLAWRNKARAWGAYDRFDTSFPDTAFALAAIRTAGVTYADVTSGLCAILTAQNADVSASAVFGSWAYTASGKATASANVSGILATTANLLEIDATRVSKGWTTLNCTQGSQTVPYTLVTATGNAINWLLSQRRKADGGFGDGAESTVFETALAYQVLKQFFPPGDASTGAALDYLYARQRADGSWNGDALQTALVLKVWPTPPTALVDTDGDGIPDAVEVLIGTNSGVGDARTLARGNGNPLVPDDTSALVVPTVVVRPMAKPPVVLEAPTGDGDVNRDGVVDAADIAIAERIALGLQTAAPEEVAHGDIAPAGARDGRIDVADVARLRRRVLGLEGP
jgi:Bacterial TSP3 repeat/Dockerin type I domain/Prenyltransferase and squalene oxidase repeat